VQEQTTGRPAERFVGPAGSSLDALFPGKYVSLTSVKRDGSAVATPVWFVIEDGRLLVNTDPQSFKAKRIRRNPAVTIAPCTASGRLRGDPVPGRAEFLPDSELERVKQLLARKYRIDRVLVLPIYRVVQRLRGARAGTAEVAIAITPT
jgi:PPOX class probable F420-dependent enzyme